MVRMVVHGANMNPDVCIESVYYRLMVRLVEPIRSGPRGESSSLGLPHVSYPGRYLVSLKGLLASFASDRYQRARISD